MIKHAKYLGQRLLSPKVIFPHTRTHIVADWSIWSTKLVDENNTTTLCWSKGQIRCLR